MLKQKVIEEIKNNCLIENGDKLVVGVSGGPDSICLLNILNEIKKDFNFSIYVCHINHGLRENATLDEMYVKEYCVKNNLEFFVKHSKIKDISKQNKIGTEEAGRKVRYDFFEEILNKKNANKIVTAHTMNDNVETIIMNLIRGTGISGLRGIDKKRDNKFIRPLLNCTRNEIEDYCKEKNLKPRIDESNRENIYTRNKIRNICIPYLEKEFNPNIICTLNRLSTIVTEENDFLLQQTINSYKKILIEENEKRIILDLKIFNNEHLVIKRRLILYTINKAIKTNNNIDKKNIDDIIRLCEKNIGNKFIYPNKNIKIMIKDKKIFFDVT